MMQTLIHFFEDLAAQTLPIGKREAPQQAAIDLMLMIYRDEYYNPETPDRGITEVITSKHCNRTA